MAEKIKKWLFPAVDPEIQGVMDAESVKNIYYMSFAIVLFEAFTMLLFILSRDRFDREAWISIACVVFCIAICLTGYLIAGKLLRQARMPRRATFLFRISYSLVMSAWAILVSCRHYNRGEQLITFFAVMLMQVCFLPLRPYLSAVMMGGVYTALYAALYAIDGAAGINKLNYFVLALISAASMSVRYHSQINTSEKAMLLQKNNDLLKYTNRHDILTGLRNRCALNEDADSLVGRHVAAFMIDIDYFKDFNDTYGHVAGDDILRATAREIRALFPDSLCYRYGGDEFLVLSTHDGCYRRETRMFGMPGVVDGVITLSIGHADGDPENQEQLFRLIADADTMLYEVKRKTHSPEHGGRERRRRP